MSDFEPENKTQVLIEFGLYIASLFILMGISFFLMGRKGLFLDNSLLLYWILYVILNFVYIGFSGLFLMVKNLSGKVLVFLHNYNYSFLDNVFEISSSNVFYKIFRSFWLSMIFWTILFLPLTLLQFVLPRQTAIFLLPVSPQVIFPLGAVIVSIIFTVFPASSGETGILAMFNSFIWTGIFKVFKNKKVGAWISIILITVISAFGWLAVHTTVNAGSEINQQSNLVFGAEQGFLMALTGSIAPAIALHNVNLLFYGIQDVVGEFEFLRIVIPIVIILLWVGMMALVIGLNRKR